MKFIQEIFQNKKLNKQIYLTYKYLINAKELIQIFLTQEILGMINKPLIDKFNLCVNNSIKILKNTQIMPVLISEMLDLNYDIYDFVNYLIKNVIYIFHKSL